ncbi:MAG: sugar phosphate isomerase/epimerase [Planctomycetes bacterium]|nr:sugar phosphate isomerase/epimerase [Planctomycetota bacterium]
MKIGVTQIVLGKLSLDDTLNLCQEAGYECVELVFQPGKDLDPAMNEGELREVAQRCRKAGVSIASVIAGLGERGNLLSLKPAEREAHKRSLIRSLEIGNRLGVNGTLLHPGQLTVEGTYEAAWDGLSGILQEVVPIAQKNGVVICLENVWNKFLLSPREMKEFVDAIRSPWLGVYLDTANMMAYGFPEHWIRGLGVRIKKVHLKDFKRAEHRFVNLMDGDTDWATVIRELRNAGYTDSLVHEIGGDRQVQIEMAKRMRKIVAL